MKIYIFLSALFLFFGCNSPQVRTRISKTAQSDSANNPQKEKIQFSDLQLENYLDSIGKLPSQKWIDQASYFSDSIFRNQLSLSDTLSAFDFKKLQKAIKSKTIDLPFARKIFRDLAIDSINLKKDKLTLTILSFDKHKYDFNEFAIYIGNSYDTEICELYFFKSNTIISKHKIDYRHGLSLDHYKDTDGKTVVYYKENYESGSGIWWYNMYFYKYVDNKIIPILNELENSNLQYPWHIRVLRLESTILKTNPLTIKMVYSQELPDTTNNLHSIINDSTVIQYNWNEQTKALEGNYSNSKLSRAQLITWYLTDNELLFINSFHNVLKKKLKDSLLLREATLKYLNEVKNTIQNKPE
jgi:hypothetical protein